MTLTHRLLLLVSVVTTTAGLVVVAGVSFGLEPTDIFLGLIVTLVAPQGLWYVQRRHDTPSNTTVTDGLEARISVPVPGVDFDDDLISAMGQDTHWAAHERVVDRLETRAKGTLVASDSHAPEKVATLLKTDEWAGDLVAARFLGTSVSIPLRQRICLFLSDRSSLIGCAERAIAVIE